jgi:hypothetical protein
MSMIPSRKPGTRPLTANLTGCPAMTELSNKLPSVVHPECRIVT